MSVKVLVELDKKKVYDAGAEAGLISYTLDGFAMAASTLVLELEYEVDSTEIKSVKVIKK